MKKAYLIHCKKFLIEITLDFMQKLEEQKNK